MALIGRLVRLSALLTGEMNVTFAKHGLNAASFDVLATLLRSGPPHSLSPNKLLDTMMVTSGTMTNRIDQLVKDDLVARIPNPNDKRSVHVQLTEKGLAKIDAAVTEHVETQKRLIAGIDVYEQSELNRLLDIALTQFKQS